MTNENLYTSEAMRTEIDKIKRDLNEALNVLLIKIGDKLSAEEKNEIKQEIEEIIELLDRLQTGLVWITFFGKTSAGKSSLINALLGSDTAPVEITHDTTKSINQYPAHYLEGRWMLTDVPGILGEPNFEQIAIDEALKAHGHIFVIDDEPYQDELDIFDILLEKTPGIPKIVFVNKWDVKMLSMTSQDRARLKEVILAKMEKYVASPESIIFGSARLFDRTHQKMVYQTQPELLDVLYDSAGTLGMVMHVLDPAERAEAVSKTIREKVFKVRREVTRRVIRVFGVLAIMATVFPFDTFTVTYALQRSAVKLVFRTMGWEGDDESLKRKAKELVHHFFKKRWKETAFIGIAEGAFSTGVVFGPLGYAADLLAELTLIGTQKFRQMVILGEVALEYAANDFSWGGEDPQKVVNECKERANVIYKQYQSLRIPPVWKRLDTSASGGSS